MVKPIPAQGQSAPQRLKEIAERNRRSGEGGVYSVCSAHPSVLEAALRQAIEDDSVLVVESTSSQVNQEGGYTGQRPQAFAEFIRSSARSAGLKDEQFLLGGDHLGPFPWRNHDASIAMEKAHELVSACVLAGYQKIHLDTSMPCGDDGEGPLDPQIVAQRAAALAEGAESAYAKRPAGSDLPVYVIGTEVPAPGGETTLGTAPAVTSADHVNLTLEAFRSAFVERGLSAAWDRVIALVVQPGVEFGDDIVFPYERAKARPLSSTLPNDQTIVYEAHSTDYQSEAALREMVEDHFAILKVGPALTFAYREAVFALCAIERELFAGSKATQLSEVRQALENAMLCNPVYWRAYYHGDEAQLRFSRAYSYSDRCRYYWFESAVQEEVARLQANLRDQALPAALISQYFPLEYEEYRAGVITAHPPDLVRSHIQAILRQYANACGTRKQH
jgi:D-tagatose-1,6-bisphosphate aldolase subunit GatZ/KbaZ